jgi:hypothetical protein
MKATLAAIGIAIMASPVMAQNPRNANIPVSTDNVFWGLAVAPLQVPAPAYGLAYGSVVRAPVRPAPGLAGGPVFDAVPLPRILDCVHVPFPQCSGGN